MITIKITDVGGYVYGDGQLPVGFNADAFMKMFMGRIIAARNAGLTEVGFTDEEVMVITQAQQQYCNDKIDAATAVHVPDEFIQQPDQLLMIGGV